VTLELELLTKLYKDNPWNADALHALGHIYYVVGNYDKAKAYFEKAVEVSPSPRGYLNLVVTLLGMGKPEEASVGARMLMASYPDSDEAKMLQASQK